MTDRPNIETLHEIGESTTNVANAWAGAEEFVSRGLVEWVRRTVADNREHAVRAAVAALQLVVDAYPATGGQAPRKYIDDMIAAIQLWVANPSHNNKESVRSALDVTRQVHAWQTPTAIPHFWVLEAVDHACLAVWSGDRQSYIVPMDFATCASRSTTCVYRALLAGGTPSDTAVARVVDAVARAT